MHSSCIYFFCRLFVSTRFFFIFSHTSKHQSVSKGQQLWEKRNKDQLSRLATYMLASSLVEVGGGVGKNGLTISQRFVTLQILQLLAS